MNRILILLLLVTIAAPAFSQEAENYTELGYFAFAKQRTDVEEDMMRFDAKKQSASVLLQWETSSAAKGESFSLERSPNGTDFTFFASVPADAFSDSSGAYRSFDFHPMDGKNYYRLTQHNKDGKVVLFPLKSVTMSKELSVNMYPNPLPGNTIHVGAGATDKINSIVVADAQGKMLCQLKANNDARGTQAFTLPNKLPAGIYLVSVLVNDIIVVKKLIAL